MAFVLPAPRETHDATDAAAPLPDGPTTVLLSDTSSSAAPRCTIRGTVGDDVLAGTSANDVICGFSGDDTIRPEGGRRPPPRRRRA
jgi:Ca2+-binding RTX toxin-like protein